MYDSCNTIIESIYCTESSAANVPESFILPWNLPFQSHAVFGSAKNYKRKGSLGQIGVFTVDTHGCITIWHFATCV